MKKLFVAVIMLTCLAACEKPIPELPAETQTGKNTFGCLVNGELVIPYNMNGYGSRAQYDRTSERLQITGHGQNYQVFQLTVDRPEVNRPAPINNVVYRIPKNITSYYYGGTNLGEITFTRFDSEIVSGTFRFIGYKHYTSPVESVDLDDFVTVTMGRFDVIMDIIN